MSKDNSENNKASTEEVQETFKIDKVNNFSKWFTVIVKRAELADMRYNVKGFIRNLEDGRIEVFLEGDSDKVNKLIELCKKGPKHAQIRNVEIKPERFQNFKVFKVLHI